MKRSYINFCNIYYDVTPEAKEYYKTREDLNLCFINGGSKMFPTTDEWTLQNVRPDNTGDNISDLNYKLNECTTLYWIWKHLDMFNQDYIGHCHYRLMFKKLPKELDKDIYVMNNIGMTFKDPKDGHIWTSDVEAGYKLCHVPWVWNFFEMHMKQCVDPKTFDEWKSLNMLIAPCQTFLMKREMFKEYMEFLFEHLMFFEFKIDLNMEEFRTKYQCRQLAFIAERLFSLWCYIKAKEYNNIMELNTIKFLNFKPITDTQERNIKI